MKKALSLLCLIALISISFLIGFFAGKQNNRAYLDGQVETAQRIYVQVKNTYGAVNSDSAEYKNVIGTIHLAKDIDLAVYQEGNVKTVRVYK